VVGYSCPDCLGWGQARVKSVFRACNTFALICLVGRPCAIHGAESSQDAGTFPPMEIRALTVNGQSYHFGKHTGFGVWCCCFAYLPLPELSHTLDARHARQANIHEHDVGALRRDQPQRFLGGCVSTDTVDACTRIEYLHELLAQPAVIFHYDN